MFIPQQIAGSLVRGNHEQLDRKLSLTIRNLSRDDGQDLVEYALVVALIAFGATATMQSLASSISLAFSNMAASLTVTSLS